MPDYKDQLGNTVTLSAVPQRIISLVPSQTELLVDLGLEDSLVGITKFCEYPARLKKQKAVVGGTKQVNLEKVKALNPDLIICNKEENTKTMVLALEAIAPVWVSDIYTLNDSLNMIESLGSVLGVSSEAVAMSKAINTKYLDFKANTNPKGLKTGYLIWKDPYMVAGANTFINAIIQDIGLENAFTTSTSRYPEVQIEDLKQLDLILLSSEPYPFKTKHLNQLATHTRAKIMLVDGSYFSWYGSRLLKAFSYFKRQDF